MQFKAAFLASLLGFAPFAAMAEPTQLWRVQAVVVPERVQVLSDALKISEIIDVMRLEGVDYGKTLEQDMFPGKGGKAWEDVVGLIYDTQTMRSQFESALAKELSADAQAVEDMIAFFGSETGQNALGLEIEARRALLDEATEEAAKVAWEDMQSKDDPRVAMINRFAEVNDLVESNVMGALNSNLAFYRGLAAAGGLPEELTEEQMLADVWGQEPDIRVETTDWLFPFLSLAYGPMTASDFEAYIAFSETPAGQKANAALFAAFDQVFNRISFDLGRAVGRQMQGEDI